MAKIKVIVDTCKTCKHFRRSANSKAGLCKAHAPKALVSEDEDTVSFYFPVVPEDEECGDHKPADWSVN